LFDSTNRLVGLDTIRRVVPVYSIAMKIHQQHPKNLGPREWMMMNHVKVIINRKLAIERVEEYRLCAIERVTDSSGISTQSTIINYSEGKPKAVVSLE